MKRIEELLSTAHAPDNLRSFNIVKSEIKQGRLVCFFGAGLSLVEEYRRWGYPFGWVANRIQSHIEAAKEAIEANRGANAAEYKILADAEKEILGMNLSLASDKESSFYLEVGDRLQNIIEKVLKVLSDVGYGETELLTSFERACQKAFRETKIMNMSVDYSPYNIPAISLLPFLGARLLTTNVDESFEKVCVDLCEYTSWHKCIVTRDMNVSGWEDYRKSIFYIHGSIQNADSLIMTQKSYDDMYHCQGQIRGTRQLLRTIAGEKSILFIGASLQDDETVSILNSDKITNAEDDLLTEGRHFIVIVERANLQNGIGIRNNPQITPCDKILFNFGRYGDISTILLQLIRETKSDWPNCSWIKPMFADAQNAISDKLEKKLNKSLSSDNGYELIKLSKEEATPPALINFLYEHHSISRHDKGLGWNICCVTGREFTLNGNSESKAHVLHNYPLGDTIYIIYGVDNDCSESSLYKKHGDKIIESIEEWQRKDRKTNDENFSLRIRVVLFPLRESRVDTEQVKREEENAVNKTVAIGNTMMAEARFYVKNLLAENNYFLTPDQWEDICDFSFEMLFEFMVELKRAAVLPNELDKHNQIGSVVNHYLQSNTKTLRHALNREGDNFE